MKSTGVVIDLDVVRAVAQQKVIARKDAAGNTLGTVVSAEILADTARMYPECRCNEMGLEAGLPIKELITLAEGCTEYVHRPRRPWICPRLNTIRSIYRPWVKRNQARIADSEAAIAGIGDGNDE